MDSFTLIIAGTGLLGLVSTTLLVAYGRNRLAWGLVISAVALAAILVIAAMTQSGDAAVRLAAISGFVVLPFSFTALIGIPFGTLFGRRRNPPQNPTENDGP